MKRLLYLFVWLLPVVALPAKAQQVNVKTNALYDLATTLSIGAEVGLGEKTSLDISGAYNPWEFSSVKRMKLWMIQPEFRYWLNERFDNHFFGAHAHVGQYNFGGIGFSDRIKESNYQGDFYGVGVSYGYQWHLNSRWALEATLGIGYTHFVYDKYPCAVCGDKIKSDIQNYWGPTKLGVSLIYKIN